MIDNGLHQASSDNHDHDRARDIVRGQFAPPLTDGQGTDTALVHPSLSPLVRHTIVLVFRKVKNAKVSGVSDASLAIELSTLSIVSTFNGKQSSDYYLIVPTMGEKWNTLLEADISSSDRREKKTFSFIFSTWLFSIESDRFKFN